MRWRRSVLLSYSQVAIAAINPPLSTLTLTGFEPVTSA